MSTRLITYRISLTGEAVPADQPPPPDYVPYPYAPIYWNRTEGDYAPGIVRPPGSLKTAADERGEGAVHLTPGRYEIKLPNGMGKTVTLSAGDTPMDLSVLLAGGIEPTDPRYPTLAGRIEEALAPVEDAVTAAEQALSDARTAIAEAEAATNRAIEAAEPLEEERRRAEAAAALAEERADRTPTATLAELDTIEPLPGRIRYVPEIGRPAWADGTEWRVAQGWLVTFDRLRIIDTLYDGDAARVYLNIAPRIPEGARE